ncbi:MAG: sulfotransferase, partial [Pseudomonadota bacterium]|nr:sulfotransferase [Pseudomonadota bacterium]
KGLKINSRSPALLVNYATVLKKTNRFDEALAAYSKALEIQPDSADFYFNAIDTCERYNKIGKAKELLSSAKSVLNPLPDDLLLTESRLLVREKRHAEALLVLDKLNFSSARSEVSIEALQIKGTCEEKVGLYKQAFSTFSAMNALTMKSERYAECDPEAYFDSAASDLMALRDYDTQRHSNRLQKPSPRLAFLIGFPRSGTTLTDTILLAHPQIKIAEEGPAIASAKACFDSLGAFNFLHHRPGQTELELGRAKYLETLHSIMEPTDNEVVIDKMPLNILRIPLITALFPTAPLIVVVRHPLDSIFSCWTQNFSLNDAMANMVSLDKICALYDVCMETLMVAAEKLQPNIVLIKYESLLSDVKGEVAPALNALGLSWDDNMEDHTAAARDRGFISTPSYSQVSQPLYM